jgi:hypothetical protein
VIAEEKLEAAELLQIPANEIMMEYDWLLMSAICVSECSYSVSAAVGEIKLLFKINDISKKVPIE